MTIRFIKPPNKIGSYKIMTTEEIIKEHEEFHDIETIIRYLYTKVKLMKSED